ncbi:MAG: cell division protein FtsL [Rhodocyclaceae bacterium]|jgi:cell division protein FtsL|nr:cell division protein FtsL [Rhodocyclaceae bacterium]
MKVRIDAVLVALVLASAFGVITAQHEARKLYAEFEREQLRAQALEVEWGRLQIEQSTWAAHARVEKLARERRAMRHPLPGQVLVLGAPR